jgi:hypothetical protein
MLRKYLRTLIPAALVLGLLLAPFHAAVIGKAGLAAARFRGLASPVTAVGNLHGFTLAYEKANRDGSVAAVLRKQRTAIVYLGPGGSQLTLSVSSRALLVKAKGGHKRVVERGLLVGASNPVASGGAQSAGFGPAGFTASRSVLADLRGSGLSQRALRVAAAQDSKLVGRLAKAYLGATPDITDSGGPGHQSSWCVAEIDTDQQTTTQPFVVADGCDVRTVLQVSSGDNYIADNMSAQAHCFQVCSALVHFNIHLAYTFTSDNQVVMIKPGQQQSTGCTPFWGGLTAANLWFGTGFSWSSTICHGTMNTQGQGGATGVGAYWDSSCDPNCFNTNQDIAIEAVAQDHATASTNPDTTLYVYVVYENQNSVEGHSLSSCTNSAC